MKRLIACILFTLTNLYVLAQHGWGRGLDSSDFDSPFTFEQEVRNLVIGIGVYIIGIFIKRGYDKYHDYYEEKKWEKWVKGLYTILKVFGALSVIAFVFSHLILSVGVILLIIIIGYLPYVLISRQNIKEPDTLENYIKFLVNIKETIKRNL